MGPTYPEVRLRPLPGEYICWGSRNPLQQTSSDTHPLRSADIAASAQDVLNDCILASGQVEGQSTLTQSPNLIYPNLTGVSTGFATSALDPFIIVTVGPN